MMIKSCKLLLKVWNLFKGLWYLIVKFLTQVTSNLFVKKEKLPALLEALLEATLQSEKKGYDSRFQEFLIIMEEVFDDENVASPAMEGLLGRFLNMVTVSDENLGTGSRRDLLKLVTSRSRVLSHSTRLQAFRELNTSFEGIVDHLYNCGDFDFQVTIVEALLRFTNKSIRAEKVTNWFPNYVKLQSAFLKIKEFEVDCRTFLNLFNEGLADQAKVMSFKVLNVTVNDQVLMKPADLPHFWVDFNLGTEAISFYYCFRDDKERNWHFFNLVKEQVTKVKIFQVQSAWKVLLFCSDSVNPDVAMEFSLVKKIVDLLKLIFKDAVSFEDSTADNQLHQKRSLSMGILPMKKQVDKSHKTSKASTSKESPAAESSGLSRTSRKSLPANLSTSNKMAKVTKRVVKAAKMSIANPVKLLKKARVGKNPENKTSEKPDLLSSEDDRDCPQVPTKALLREESMKTIPFQYDLLECPQKEQSLPDAQEMVPFEAQEDGPASKSDVASTSKNSLLVEAAVKEVASKSGKFQRKSSNAKKDSKLKESVQKPIPIEEVPVEEKASKNPESQQVKSLHPISANIEEEGIALKKLQRKSSKRLSKKEDPSKGAITEALSELASDIPKEPTSEKSIPRPPLRNPSAENPMQEVLMAVNQDEPQEKYIESNPQPPMKEIDENPTEAHNSKASSPNPKEDFQSINLDQNSEASLKKIRRRSSKKVLFSETTMMETDAEDKTGVQNWVPNGTVNVPSFNDVFKKTPRKSVPAQVKYFEEVSSNGESNKTKTQFKSSKEVPCPKKQPNSKPKPKTTSLNSKPLTSAARNDGNKFFKSNSKVSTGVSFIDEVLNNTDPYNISTMQSPSVTKTNCRATYSGQKKRKRSASRQKSGNGHASKRRSDVLFSDDSAGEAEDNKSVEKTFPEYTFVKDR